MSKAYIFLRIAALLIVALAILGLGFSALPSIRDKCLLIAPIGACKFANTSLSALLLFFVAYYTLSWINKLRKNLHKTVNDKGDGGN